MKVLMKVFGQWSGSGTKKTRAFDRIVLPIVGAVVIIGGGLFWFQTSTAKRAFSDLDRHLDPGETRRYGSRFPTSGPHSTIWTRPGFYDEPQPPTQLVHALEHGNVVIYYDQPPVAVETTLADWADLFTGQWDGLVVAKMSGLGESLVLTAWTRRLDLDAFDAEAAAAFVDANRGRGPENSVR